MVEKNRWLEAIMPLTKRPETHIADYPAKDGTDPVYDSGDRGFWTRVVTEASLLATQHVQRLAPELSDLTYRPLDQAATKQVDGWAALTDAVNAERKWGRYCRKRHYPAQHVLDHITGDQDVMLAGYNPRPTLEDIKDDLAFGFVSNPVGTIESIRAASRGYSTLGFVLWQKDKVVGFVSGNATRRNYGRNHLTLELLEKAPDWRVGSKTALPLLGLPALFAAQLTGKSVLMVAGADDPPGFHRLLQRQGFQFGLARNPEGYGCAGMMHAPVAMLAARYALPLPEPMVPAPVRFDKMGRLQAMRPDPS